MESTNLAGLDVEPSLFTIGDWTSRSTWLLFLIMAEFLTSQDGNVTILSISGRLDPSSGKELRDSIERAADPSKKNDLLVDLSSVDYMASAGFRELFLAGRKLARQGSRLAVCGLGGEVKRVFELARFDTAYPIYADRAEGIAALQAS